MEGAMKKKAMTMTRADAGIAGIPNVLKKKLEMSCNSWYKPDDFRGIIVPEKCPSKAEFSYLPDESIKRNYPFFCAASGKE